MMEQPRPRIRPSVANGSLVLVNDRLHHFGETSLNTSPLLAVIWITSPMEGTPIILSHKVIFLVTLNYTLEQFMTIL